MVRGVIVCAVLLAVTALLMMNRPDSPPEPKAAAARPATPPPVRVVRAPTEQVRVVASDPVALLQAAVDAKDPVQFEAAAAVAAASGDPDAQILLGRILLGRGEDPIDGLAWMLVGCPDCMVEDPRLGFEQCVDFGTCYPGMSFVDWFAANEGWEPVLQAQARAAGLKALYTQGTEP